MGLKPIIYIGPSLSHSKARSIFGEAEYRAPARKGELLTLALDPDVRMVGLVDGVFLQDYPPTPIEVYRLVKKKNCVLAGAASLGALRAVELNKYGMIGIGSVYRLYNSGKLCADDEVAVTFSDEDYRLQSEAMVDVRFNLYRAEKKGVIGNDTRMAIARAAKRIYFPHRTYDHIVDTAIQRHPSLADEIDKFHEFISTERKSLKELDAIRLIRHFKHLAESGEAPRV